MNSFLIAPLLLALSQASIRPTMPGPPPPLRMSPPMSPVAVSARAIDANSWITTDDYPVPALRAGAEGEVTITYRVGADGLVSDCMIVESSGVPALDAATCPLITMRARFIPARDAAGKPVVERKRQRIAWTLPVERPEAPLVSGFVGAAVPVYSDHSGACALASSRPELRPLAEDFCSELPALLSPGPTPLPTNALPSTLAVMTVERIGERAARQPRPWGELVYREEASFDVGPLGDVSNCRSNIVRNWRAGSEFDLCRFLATTDGPFFAADPTATAPRRARIAVSIYRQDGYVDIRRL